MNSNEALYYRPSNATHSTEITPNIPPCACEKFAFHLGEGVHRSLLRPPGSLVRAPKFSTHKKAAPFPTGSIYQMQQLNSTGSTGHKTDVSSSCR